MQTSPKKEALPSQIIDHTNIHEFPSEEFFKWSANGEWVYMRRVFANGSTLFSCFDINDPGQYEIPVTRHAYAAVRCQESRR